MKTKYQIIILVSLLCFSCQQKPENVDYSQLNTGDLFTYFLSTNDSSEIREIYRMLSDTIKESIDPVFYTILLIDTSSQKIGPHFLFTDHYEPICIKERNIYVIGITGEDSLFVEGEHFPNLNSARIKLKDFILNPNNLDHLPQKKYKVIEFLGERLVSRGAVFFIVPPMHSDSSVVNSTWINLRNEVNNVIHIYNDVRDESALQIWNIKYNELEYEKQLAICELLPIHIFIFFNRKLYTYEDVPPPPPEPIDISY